MHITIKPLTPELINDYLFLFDNIVFTENPEWSACYCFSFHFTGTGEQWKKENNRASVISYINENKMNGYLAYSHDKPVGWCNANNRSKYQALSKYYKLTGSSEEKICSVVCFVVDPDYRRQGIAQRLLEQVCSDCSAQDYDYIEAYPAKGILSCERQYKGPMELYKRLNFKVENEYENYSVVRKKLK
jgi:ribosomal protein S18 acetylase RimI-like enzyme